MQKQSYRLNINTEKQWPKEGRSQMQRIPSANGHHREKTGLTPEPDYQAVAKMAYELWEKGGRQEGSADTYWFRAEAALKPR